MHRSRITLAAGAIAGAAPALASGGGGMGQALIQPQVGTIFWTLLTFAAMVVILRWVAWKPLLGALESRESSIRDTIAEAKRDRDGAERALAEQRQLVAEARRERAEALGLGQRDAERLKAEILEEARLQRERLLQQTEAQVAAGLRQARGELREAAADLALQAAQKLLSGRLDEASHRQLIEDYLAELEESGGGSPLPS